MARGQGHYGQRLAGVSVRIGPMALVGEAARDRSLDLSTPVPCAPGIWGG